MEKTDVPFNRVERLHSIPELRGTAREKKKKPKLYVTSTVMVAVGGRSGL